MSKRSYSEMAYVECGTCIAIAASLNNLGRMAEILQRGPSSLYLFWPWGHLNTTQPRV